MSWQEIGAFLGFIVSPHGFYVGDSEANAGDAPVTRLEN